MPKLFIIGNGFDLAHELPTSYEEFHQFLLEDNPGAGDYPWMSGIVTGPHGEDLIDGDAAVTLMCYLIDNVLEGDNWNDLENTLGKLDLSMCLKMALDPSECTDREGDIDWRWVWENRSECCEHLSLSTEYLYDQFESWIEYVEEEYQADVRTGFQKVISPQNDIFLTFNYTRTLERVYGCKNVCHIHGQVGESIVFGHGGPTHDMNTDDPYDPYNLELEFNGIYESMRKNTSDVIEKHNSFFNQLNKIQIDSIYSHGFSFSTVDEPYIEKVCHTIPTKGITWYFNDHETDKRREEFKETIRRCGFEGTFEVFSITD